MGISINRLARDIVVPPGRISEIVNSKRGITADTALRLARFFGDTPVEANGLRCLTQIAFDFGECIFILHGAMASISCG